MIDFEHMDYSIFKVKYFFKFAQLFFFINSTRLKSRNWVLVEQALQLANLKYYKIYNVMSHKITSFSIFKSTKLLINGSTIFAEFKSLKLYNELKQITKVVNTHPLLVFLSVKFNNKVYSFSQLQKIDFSSYYSNFFSIFHYFIKKKFKEQQILNFNNFYLLNNKIV